MSEKVSEIKSLPKISIVTPSFNSAKFIEDCILSVVNQRYPSFEHLIIDGGSTDNTLEILRKYPHLKWISEKDEGIYDAMNKGIKLAIGQIIGILNSDDFYEPNILELVMNVFENNKEVGLVHGNMKVLYNEKTFKISRYKDYQKYYGMWIKHPTCFVRKDVYTKHGVFDKQYRDQADYDLVFRFLKNGVKFFYLPLVITNFRVGGYTTKNWSFRESISIRTKNGHPLIWAVISAVAVRTLFRIKLMFHR